MKNLIRNINKRFLSWICIFCVVVTINISCDSGNKPKIQDVEKYDSVYIQNDTLTKNGRVVNMFMPSKMAESEGQVISGKKNGVWKFYKEDGKLVEIVNYEHGYKHGRNIKYNDVGGIVAVYNYNKAILHGEQLVYWENSKVIKTRNNYSSGVKSGICVEYFENGKTSQRITYENDMKNGKFEEYDYLDELKRHYQSGEGFYKMNKKNGVWRHWDFYYDIAKKTLGDKKILTDYQTYEDNKLNGKSIEFDSETGKKLIETFYLNGLESGIRKSYCPSGPNRGKLWIVEYYEDGEKISDEPYKCNCID